MVLPLTPPYLSLFPAYNLLHNIYSDDIDSLLNLNLLSMAPLFNKKFLTKIIDNSYFKEISSRKNLIFSYPNSDFFSRLNKIINNQLKNLSSEYEYCSQNSGEDNSSNIFDSKNNEPEKINIDSTESNVENSKTINLIIKIKDGEIFNNDKSKFLQKKRKKDY